MRTTLLNWITYWWLRVTCDHDWDLSFGPWGYQGSYCRKCGIGK